MRNAWYWFYSNFFQCSLDFHILLIINFPMIIVFVTAIFSAARNIYLLIDDFSEPNSCMENGGRDRINCSDVWHHDMWCARYAYAFNHLSYQHWAVQWMWFQYKNSIHRSHNAHALHTLWDENIHKLAHQS